MKHLIFQSRFLILLLGFLTLGISQAWGADTEQTLLSFSRSGSSDSFTSGYTFSKDVESKTGYYQDGSGTLRYLQLKQSSALFTTTPSAVTVNAKLGGGSTKNPLSNNVYACFVDKDGNDISGSEVTLTTQITSTTGSDFSVSMSTSLATKAYGLKIYHEKETGYNVRYYSFSLTYIAGSSKTLSSITISGTPTKTTYEAGESFEYAGLTATGKYSDDSEENITNSVEWTSSVEPLTQGTTSIIVTATKGTISGNKTINGLTVTQALGDKLTRESTGVSDGSTSYSAWTNKTGSQGVAKYAGKSAGSNNSIQLNSTSPNGIVSTTSAGLIKKVKVNWNSNTSTSKTKKVIIFGSNTAYSGSVDLYGTTTQGTQLGEINYNNGGTELEITEEYEYVGVKANDALYLNYITFVWEKAVTFNLNGGEGDTPETVTDFPTNLPSTSGFTKTGYTPNGWNTKADGSGTHYNDGASFSKPETSAKLYVQWTAKQADVILSAPSATDGGTDKITATYDQAMPTATMPKRTGYTFNGYFDAETSGTKYYNADGTSARAWDKEDATFTLHAQWTANKYKITYKDEGDVAFTGSTANLPTEHIYDIPTDLVVSSKTGYTFEGWFKDVACTTPIETLGATDYLSDITIYAKWTARTTTVSFEKNTEDDVQNMPAGTITNTFDAALTTAGVTIPSRIGYTFVGWFDSSSKKYYGVTNNAITVSVNKWDKADENVTLSAHWEANVYQIGYKDENDKDFSGSMSGLPTKHTYGSETTLTNTSKTGYNFVGWFSDAACTTPISTLGATDYLENITIFAKWSEIMPASISLSPDITAIELIYDGSATEKAKKITTTVNPATAFDRTFTWSVEEGSDVVEVASDGTITAKAAGTAKVKVASTRDANIYKEISVTVHALPQITWLNMDGSTFTTSKGTSAGKVGSLPADKPTSCDTEKYPYFRGWSATNFGKTTTNPESGFVTKDTEVALDGEYTYYAVFSSKVASLNFGTPAVSDDFESCTEQTSTTTHNPAGAIDNCGIFKSCYSNSTSNSYGVQSDSYGKYLHFKGSSKPLILGYDNKSTFSTTGVWSVKINKNANCHFGLYSEITNNAVWTKLNARVYLQYKNGVIEVADGTSTGWNSTGYTYSGDAEVVEITMIYNATNSATTYGDNIALGAGKAHVYVNGEAIMNGDNPKEMTISKTATQYFRIADDNTTVAKFYDVNIYNSLPTLTSIEGCEWATQCCAPPTHELAITPIASFKKGQTTTLQTTGGNGNAVSWSASNGTVTINSTTGEITGVVTGDVVITAHQEANGDVCEQTAVYNLSVISASEYGILIHDAIGGSAVAKNVVPEVVTKAEKGDVITITATPADDYNFTGWTVNAGGVTLADASASTTTFTMGEADVEITPSFALKQFTITLNAGNGTVEGGSTKVLENQDIHSKITLPDAVACNSDEWEFKGWATSSVMETTTEPTFVSAEYEVTGNVELFAVYGQGEVVYGDYKYKIYAKLSDSDKRYLKGKPYASGQKVNTIAVGTEEDAQIYTLVTIDVAANKYALKYTNNSIDEYLCILKETKNSSTSYYLQSTTSLSNAAYWTMSDGAKGGKIFANVEHTSYGIIYRDKDASTTYNCVRAYNTSNVTESSTQYYDLNLQLVGREQKEGGVWNSNPSCAHHYQVTYDGNGATTTCASEKLEEGEITLCADEPVLAGYTFVGWNDGTSTYAAGAKYNLTAATTFTAVWNPIKIETITLNVTEPQTLNWKSDLAAAPTFQLSVANTTPAAVADKTVSWSVSEGTAVSVSETGLVTAVDAGTATVTATANDGSGVTASCTFTVTKTYKLTIIDPEVITIKVNNSQTKNQYFEVNTPITLTKSVSKGYNFGEWVVMQGETPITVTDDKFTMPAAEVTVTATFTTQKDYYVDDMNDNAQIVMEGKYTVPSLPDVVTPTSTNSCESTHLYFVGWIETEISSGQEEVPTDLITAGTEKTAAEKTYHAVWAEDANNNQ